jgi:hypothetical protein
MPAGARRGGWGLVVGVLGDAPLRVVSLVCTQSVGAAAVGS